MSKRNHDRAPDKKGFSVALPKSLLKQIEKIADNEHRSRNRQIEAFLEQAVCRYEEENAKLLAPKTAGKPPPKKSNS